MVHFGSPLVVFVFSALSTLAKLNDGQYQIVNEYGGRIRVLTNNGKGVPTTIESINPNDTRKIWMVESNSEGQYTIRNVESGLYAGYALKSRTELIKSYETSSSFNITDIPPLSPTAYIYDASGELVVLPKDYGSNIPNVILEEPDQPVPEPEAMWTFVPVAPEPGV